MYRLIMPGIYESNELGKSVGFFLLSVAARERF
jgi:hypothetical protein